MPGEIRSKFGVTRFDGKIVRAFPFKDHESRMRAPIAGLWGATTKLSDLLSAAQAQFSKIETSGDYTPVGRRVAKAAWAKANAGAIKDAVEAMSQADAKVKDLRSSMASPTVDKSDVVGAMRRAEIRTYLRGIPDAQRATMLRDGPTWAVDPEIALAVIEAPAVLSGVDEEARSRLVTKAHGVRYPGELAEIEDISAATEAVADTVAVVAETLLSQGGLSQDEVSQLMGQATYAERLAAKFAGLGDEAAA